MVGAIVVALLVGSYVPLTLFAPLTPVAAVVLPVSVKPAAVAQPALPSYGASGIGAVGSDGLLASAGSTAALPIASISKVITTLVVLDKRPIAAGSDGPTITFTAADVAVYQAYLAANGSVQPVRAGLQLTERQVMELMLVGSANNYARSLVNWAFGSETAYAAAAKPWLAAHGMTATSISDATGMSPQNTSTPKDLVTLGKLAIADPVVSSIISQQQVTVPNVGAVKNTNTLLGVDGIDGIKTGTLDQAGACLLFSADVPVGDKTVTLVGAVLDGVDHPTVNTSVRALLASVEAGFHQVTLSTAGERFAEYTTPWGTTADAVAATTSSAVVWSATPVTTAVATHPITLTAAGRSVGSVTFTVGTQKVTVALTLRSAVDDPGAWWRLTNPGNLF